MTSSSAGQHALSQHEEPCPERQVSMVVDNRGKAAMECPGPAIPGSLGDMMEDGDMELKMVEKGGRAHKAGEEGDRIGEKR